MNLASLRAYKEGDYTGQLGINDECLCLNCDELTIKCVQNNYFQLKKKNLVNGKCNPVIFSKFQDTFLSLACSIYEGRPN